jgi:antitoxin (DNA-binding transcriptional repressor) of toxin-antitoxin stability system
MDQIYSLSEAKAKFSEIINRIIFRNERFVITKKGKAVAQVSPIGHSEEGDGIQDGLIRAHGCLHDISDDDVDEMVERIYEARHSEIDRTVDI